MLEEQPKPFEQLIIASDASVLIKKYEDGVQEIYEEALERHVS